MFGLLNFNWVSPMDFVFKEGADLLYLIFHFIFIVVMFCRGMILTHPALKLKTTLLLCVFCATIKGLKFGFEKRLLKGVVFRLE